MFRSLGDWKIRRIFRIEVGCRYTKVCKRRDDFGRENDEMRNVDMYL